MNWLKKLKAIKTNDINHLFEKADYDIKIE